jgi:hypothetical protein
MSLYRQPGRAAGRTIAIAATVALLAGGGIGYAIGAAGGDPTPSVRTAIANLGSGVQPVRDGLELVSTEYAQAVRGGRVVAATEYGAAKADVQRAQAAVAAHRADLRALAPAGTARLDAALVRLADAVAARADGAVVDRLAGAAQAQIDAILPR